jgi:hypothetical protein
VAAKREAPTEVVLRDWGRSSNHVPLVCSVSVVGDRAEVVLEVESGYEEWCYLARRDGVWTSVSSGNGAT